MLRMILTFHMTQMTEEDLTLNPEDFEDDKNGYTSIVYGREDLRLRDDPPFLGRKGVSIPDDVPHKNPIDFFELFMDMPMMTIILTETNRYAADYLALDVNVNWMAAHPSSRLHQWPANGISMQTLKQYIGLLLNMGLTKKKSSVASY